MITAYISMGSNLGDRRRYLREALHLLQNEEKLSLTMVSSLYETEPVGFLEQGKFFNAALALQTRHSPHALLEILLHVESRLERRRTMRWGPRTVDLDLLFYGALVLDDPILTLPHPRVTERAFVLFPLAEIAPFLLHPLSGKTIRDHLEELPGKSGVQKLAGKL